MSKEDAVPTAAPTASSDTHWTTRAACRWRADRPDYWLSANPAERRIAAHICLNHCPVFVQCDTQRRVQPCAQAVQAAVLYDSDTIDPQPVIKQPNPDAVRCGACGTTPKAVSKRGQMEAAPRTVDLPQCGTLTGVAQHRRAGTDLCAACTAAERVAVADRLARRHGYPTAAAYGRDVATVRRLAGEHYTDREIAAQMGVAISRVRNVRRTNSIEAGVSRGSASALSAPGRPPERAAA
jgi:hypothetical protein